MEKAPPAESSAMSQSAADSMLLDPYVYEEDCLSSAAFRANACTTLGHKFEVAFLPAIPPAISRFYVCWLGGTKPEDTKGAEVVDCNKDLVLLRITLVENLEEDPYISYTQDHFLCVARSEPLPHLLVKRLPVCKVPLTIPPYEEDDDGEETLLPRIFFPKTMGITPVHYFDTDGNAVSVDTDGKAVRVDTHGKAILVAQLAKVSRRPNSCRKMEAEVCMLRFSISGDDRGFDGKWDVKKIPILHQDNAYTDLWHWSTDAVLSSANNISWVDYQRGGILTYRVRSMNNAIGYERLNISDRPTGSAHCRTLPEMTRSLCVSTCTQTYSRYRTPVIRFVDVVRSDKYILGPFELGSGFTIKSSSPSLLDGGWIEDVDVTSHDLWDSNTSDLPHEMLTFPVVSAEDYNTVHFLVSQYVEEEGEEIKKISVVTIDMDKKTVLSVDPYIEEGEKADMIKKKCSLLKGLMSSMFTSFFRTNQGIEEEQKED